MGLRVDYCSGRHFDAFHVLSWTHQYKSMERNISAVAPLQLNRSYLPVMRCIAPPPSWLWC